MNDTTRAVREATRTDDIIAAAYAADWRGIEDGIRHLTPQQAADLHDACSRIVITTIGIGAELAAATCTTGAIGAIHE